MKLILLVLVSLALALLEVIDLTAKHALTPNGNVNYTYLANFVKTSKLAADDSEHSFGSVLCEKDGVMGHLYTHTLEFAPFEGLHVSNGLSEVTNHFKRKEQKCLNQELDVNLGSCPYTFVSYGEADTCDTEYVSCCVVGSTVRKLVAGKAKGSKQYLIDEGKVLPVGAHFCADSRCRRKEEFGKSSGAACCNKDSGTK